MATLPKRKYLIIASGASLLVCRIARAVYIYVYIYIYIYIYILYIIVRMSFRKCTPFLNSEYNFTSGLSLTCNNIACGGIREPNAVAFTSNNRKLQGGFVVNPQKIGIKINP